MNEATILSILLGLGAMGMTWVINRFKIWAVNWSIQIRDAGTTLISTILGVGIAFLLNLAGLSFYPDQTAWLTILSGLGVTWGASLTWEVFHNKFKKPPIITPS